MEASYDQPRTQTQSVQTTKPTPLFHRTHKVVPVVGTTERPSEAAPENGLAILGCGSRRVNQLEFVIGDLSIDVSWDEVTRVVEEAVPCNRQTPVRDRPNHLIHPASDSGLTRILWQRGSLRHC